MIQQELQNRFSNENIVSRVMLIDFDRLVGDTGKIVRAFGAFAAESADLSTDQLSEMKIAQNEAEGRGRTFDMYKHLQLTLGHEATIRILGEFEASDHENYLLPGADELIDMCESGNDPFCLFTFPTGDRIWQKTKINVTGNLSEIPCWMTETSEKGQILSDLYDETEECFLLPESMGGLRTDSVVLFDDKASSFNNFPPLPSYGYHVLDPVSALPSQKGRVASNIIPLPSLHAAVAHAKQARKAA